MGKINDLLAYVDHPGTVVVMRGIPGSGKSTLARLLAGEDGVICSSDALFMRDGEYRFDPRRLKDNHQQCIRDFISLVRDGAGRVVVDNTNTTVAAIQPYYAVAEAYQYAVQIVEAFVSDPLKAVRRNVHAVPVDVALSMWRSLQSQDWPTFWKTTYVTEDDWAEFEAEGGSVPVVERPRIAAA